MAPAPIVQMKDISICFGKHTVLDKAELTLYKGEILGLVGDNGAGKSTLLKILSGSINRDGGLIMVHGQSRPKLTPGLSRSLGIEMVYQDLSLCEDMSVWENIFLGRYICRQIAGISLPVLNKAKMRQAAASFIKRLGLEIPDVDQPPARLSGGQKQAVAICRGLMFNPAIMLLDEPTASMAIQEQLKILKLISDIRSRGTAVIMISHDLSRLLGIADRVTVLKAGSTIWSGNADQTDPEDLVKKMFVIPAAQKR